MRAIWKGPFVDLSVLKQVDILLKSRIKKKIIKIWSRRSVIFPSFLGLNFAVFNGKIFVIFCISKNMVGHKFGEFSSTKVIHKK
jgi:small subunit ribosomal protein S19